MIIDGVRPNTQILDSQGNVVGNARTYGDAYEQASRHASDSQDAGPFTWLQPVSFRGEAEPVDPEEPVNPSAPREFVPMLIEYGYLGDEPSRWAVDPDARLFETSDFEPGDMYRIPDSTFGYKPGGIIFPPADNGSVTFDRLRNGVVTSHTWVYDFR